MLFLLVALAAAPVHIESLGFTVEVQDDAVNVTEVTPGSSAAAAGLPVGMRIVRVMQPMYMFGNGKLADLEPTDLHDRLSTTHLEPLTLSGFVDGKRKVVSIPRIDPPPPKAEPRVLTADQVKRLSMVQMSMYYAQLPTAMKASRPPEPVLSYKGQVIASITPDGVKDVTAGAATPEWIYLIDSVRYSCPGAAMRSIELSGPAPVTKVLATSNDGSLQGSSIGVQIPLWRVKDARLACKRGETRLQSVVLLATVRCEGLEPLTMNFSHELELECLRSPPDDSLATRRSMRSAERLIVGGPGTLKMPVEWRQLRPRPRQVTIVELDASGALVKRMNAVPPPAFDIDFANVVVNAQLDTSKERTLMLGIELRFPDGTVELRPVLPVAIVSPAFVEEEKRAFAVTAVKFQDVLERLQKQFKDPCAKPDETVAWLSKQPGVELATNHEGHNLSYVVDGLPFMVMCHHP